VNRIRRLRRLPAPGHRLASLAALVTALGASTVLAGPSLGLPVDIVAESAPPAGAFPPVTADGAAPLWYDANDYPGVVRALGDLRHRRHGGQERGGRLT
jgi:hypothetical protein